MIAAPRIWVFFGDFVNIVHKTNKDGENDGLPHYHLARPTQPCSTDEFLSRLQRSKHSVYVRDEIVREWLAGDFAAAMEGLE